MNSTDIQILVLVLIVVWFTMLWQSLNAKNLLCLTLLLFPGFPLIVIVLNLSWGPAFGEWLHSYDEPVVERVTIKE